MEWQEWAEPIVEDVFRGWQLGVYSCHTREGFEEILAHVGRRVQEAYGREGVPQLDPYSMVCGHILGQVVERRIRHDT